MLTGCEIGCDGVRILPALDKISLTVFPMVGFEGCLYGSFYAFLHIIPVNSAISCDVLDFPKDR